MRGGCINPLIHKAEDVEKVSFMVTETMGKGDEQLPITGLVVIIDMDGLTLEHLTNRSLSLSKKLMKFYQVVRNLIIGMLCFANLQCSIIYAFYVFIFNRSFISIVSF